MGLKFPISRDGNPTPTELPTRYFNGGGKVGDKRPGLAANMSQWNLKRAMEKAEKGTRKVICFPVNFPKHPELYVQLSSQRSPNLTHSHPGVLVKMQILGPHPWKFCSKPLDTYFSHMPQGTLVFGGIWNRLPQRSFLVLHPNINTCSETCGTQQF